MEAYREKDAMGRERIVARELSAYAFVKYGKDAALYNGIFDLETAAGAPIDPKLEDELERARR